MKILHECFITTQMRKGMHYVTYYNPSVKDYLTHYISTHPGDRELLLKNILYPQQLLNFIEESRDRFNINDWYNRGNIEVGVNLLTTIGERFREIIRDPVQHSCRLERTAEGLRKEPYREAVFLKEFAERFPSVFTSLIPEYKDRLEQIVKDGESENFYHRTYLMKKIFSHIPTEEARRIMQEMSEEIILVEDCLEFIRMVKESGNRDIVVSEEFTDRVEETIIVDIDSNIHCEEDYDNLVSIYEEIAEELEQPLERAFGHLKEVKEELSPSDDIDEDAYDQYREGMNSYDAEEYEIDRMMETLRKN